MQFLQPENLPLVIGVALACLFLAALSYYGVQALKIFRTNKEFEYLSNLADAKVRELRLALNMAGPRKHELVMVILRTVRDRIGSKLTDQDLEMIIKAAYQASKQIALISETLEDDELLEAILKGIDGAGTSASAGTAPAQG